MRVPAHLRRAANRHHLHTLFLHSVSLSWLAFCLCRTVSFTISTSVSLWGVASGFGWNWISVLLVLGKPCTEWITRILCAMTQHCDLWFSPVMCCLGSEAKSAPTDSCVLGLQKAWVKVIKNYNYSCHRISKGSLFFTSLEDGPTKKKEEGKRKVFHL